jgi:hypothetical protein
MNGFFHSFRGTKGDLSSIFSYSIVFDFLNELLRHHLFHLLGSVDGYGFSS